MKLSAEIRRLREYVERWQDSQGHAWFQFREDKFNSCRKCGVIQRADRKHKPCEGWVQIIVRKPPTEVGADG